MDRFFVVISGLPGSGKSTLARQLATALGLPLQDKDTILERLYESKGVGDAAWRRALSRESDRILQAESTVTDGAVLVSHWHLPGMLLDSGTPTDWLLELSADLVNVHCECDPEVAIERYIRRKRHPGHLDNEKLPSEVEASIRAVGGMGYLNIGLRVDVNASQPLTLDAVLRNVQSALELLRTQRLAL